MFDAIPDAQAAAPAITDALGPYPILQLFGGILALVFVAATLFLWKRGEKQPLPPPAPFEAQQIYLQGPMQVALNSLADIVKALDRIERNQDATADKLMRQTVAADRYTAAIERMHELLGEAVRLLSLVVQIKGTRR